jgi:hypothetical protein
MSLERAIAERLRRAEERLQPLPDNSYLKRLWLPRLASNPLIAERLADTVSPLPLRELDVLLTAVEQRAKKTGKGVALKDLRRRLTAPAHRADGSYRHPFAALFEGAVMGVAVQHWDDDVELWPVVPGTSKHCELRVVSRNAEFYGEAKGMWREEDRSQKAFGWRPAEAFYDDEVQRLVSTVREAAVQLPSGGPNVCFALYRHLLYPGLFPSGEGTKQDVYGRLTEVLRGDTQVQVDVVVVFHEWNPPDLILITDNAPLESELHRAFELHWPQQPNAERAETT